MNKSELVQAVATATGVSKKDTEATINAVIDTIEKTTKKGDKVSLIGFGTFEVVKRKARTGRNPKTGESIKIAARKAPVFKAGKVYKDMVN